MTRRDSEGRDVTGLPGLHDPSDSLECEKSEEERTMTAHDLKTWPTYFAEVWHGRKLFEIRRNDRDFREDDTLLLREWDPGSQDYTGRELTAEVTCVVDSVPEWGLMDGFCIMSIKVIDRHLPGKGSS